MLNRLVRFRIPFPLALLFAALTFAGCTSGACNQPNSPNSPNEIATMPAPPPQAENPCMTQSPCAGGLCAARPPAAAADPIPMMVYGEPGAGEHLMGVALIPPGVMKCAVDTAHRVGIDFLDGIDCAIRSLRPQPPPSRRYVMFARPPAAQMPAPPKANPCQPPPPPAAPPQGCGK